MTGLATDLLFRLGWASAYLAGAGVLATVMLRLLHMRSPRIREAVGWAVLLHGVAFFHVTLAIPWYAREPIGPANANGSNEIVSPDWHATKVKADTATVRTPATMEEFVLADTAQQQSRCFRWPLLVAAVWFGGVFFVVARWTRGYLSFLHAFRGWPCDRRDWTQQWEALLKGAGVKRQIPIHLGYGVGPALCWHPAGYRLIVPVRLWQRLSGEQRQFVMRHELAHYLRGDIWRLLLARLLALPHWFNPLAWSAVSTIELATEFASDDLASRGEEGASVDYAKTLLAIGESQCRPPVWTTAGGGGCLVNRISRTLSTYDTKDSRMKTSLVLTASLIAAIAAVVRIDLVAQAGPHSGDEATTVSSPDSQNTEQQLTHIRELAKQKPVPFEKLEAIAAQAATSPDAGRIYAEVAGIYHEHGGPHRTIAWAQVALRTPLTPLERLRMFQYWSQAADRHDREQAPSGSGSMSPSAMWPAVLGLIEASQYRIPVEGLDELSARQLVDKSEMADASWIVDHRGDLEDARDAIVAVVAHPKLERFMPELNPALKRLLLCECYLDGGTSGRETPLWLSEGRSFACTFGIDYSRLLEDLAPVAAVLYGSDGWLDEILAGLKSDPNGPQIDIKSELIPCLGQSTTFVADCQEPLLGRGKHHLLAIELTRPQQAALILDRCYAKDPDSQLIAKDGMKVWALRTRGDEFDRAVCVAHDHLIVSDFDLLVETLRRAK